MFGINKLIVKLALIVVGGAVLICVGVCGGCSTPADVVTGAGGTLNKTETEQKQLALAVKNETDSSHTDNRQDNDQDNSLTVNLGDEPENQELLVAAAQPLPVLPDLPVVDVEEKMSIEQANKIIDAKVEEREILLKAAAKAQIKAVEAGYKIKEQKLLTDLAVVQESKSEAIANITEAKAKMREVEILAEAEAKAKIIAAESKNLRLIIWIVGIGLVVAFGAYLAQSPWDKSRKKVENA